MSVETELVALTTATTNLLDVVNEKKSALDAAVVITTEDAEICEMFAAFSLVLAAQNFGAL